MANVRAAPIVQCMILQYIPDEYQIFAGNVWETNVFNLSEQIFSVQTNIFAYPQRSRIGLGRSDANELPME